MIARVRGFHRQAIGEIRYGRTLAEPRLFVEVDGADDIAPWTNVRIADTSALVVAATRTGDTQRLALRADEWPITVEGHPGRLHPDADHAGAGPVGLVGVHRFTVTARGQEYRLGHGRLASLECVWLGHPVRFLEPTTSWGGEARHCVRHASNLGVTEANIEILTDRPLEAA